MSGERRPTDLARISNDELARVAERTATEAEELAELSGGGKPHNCKPHTALSNS
jgi:hypothetical protein